jgi:Leucine-rich repeat (LRR) protein
MLGWTKKITFLFLLLFSAFSVTAQVEEWMPDATLRQAVLTTLDLSAGVPLTKDKMLLLKRLVAVNHLDTTASIIDITGLEYAKNLRHLDLGGNNNHIQDLRPLSNLIHLTSLHIWHTTLKGPVTDLDLHPLTNLVQLEVLSLSGNGITDITLLSHFTKLRKLHLTHNYITDITPLSHLIELRELKLRNNYIEDFSPVLNLPNLVEFLYDEVCDS